MRFVDEYRSNEKVQTLLEAIRKKVTRPWYIMEICGGQTHAIARYRLEEMLPPDLQLLHGPGCPVCVTPVETIDYALKLATQPNVILASFGDMMRVPGSKEDLLSVKARGADIRMLYTPLDALSLAEENPDKEIVFVDEIKGEVKLPENIHDIVLLKKDGIPTYHFAHAIDDHLMRTTVVVRGGEWLASAPIHYELFHVLGFKMPKYAHTAHLMKFDEETGGKRKLSKRKDPELSLDYYRKDGYHPYTMKVYLMTLLNSNFEEWHEKFPDKDINEFPFSLDKMSTSGALFDKDKLHNICKNELSKLSEDELYDFLYDWAEENEPEKKNIWFADKEKMLGILRLYMGIGMKRRRKDFMYAKQIFEMIGYFFDMEDTQEKDEFRMDMEDVKTILNEYLSMYNHEDDNSEWFNKLKAIADKHGYASDMKAYKANPEAFKGNVSDIAEVIRIAVTGKANTPDLWSIVHVMGEAQMRDKIQKVLA